MIRDLLVGSTGFVGGNIMRSHEFSASCHSINVQSVYDSNPDLCVYAGIPASMFLANHNPEVDMNIMRSARENIRAINPKRLVLISSIAVYLDSRGKDENSIMQTEGLPAYGANRLQLEQWIREDYPKVLIIRLPALYGLGLKKNFLYDLHNIIPSMLTSQKYEDLSRKSDLIRSSYSLQKDGFYRVSIQTEELKNFFRNNDFNALSFTDSRSKYQFYNLARLWSDILIGLEHELLLLNICTPPVSAKKVYEYITGDSNWNNELDKTPFDYDIRTIHADKFSSEGMYLCSQESELNDILSFMKAWSD